MAKNADARCGTTAPTAAPARSDALQVPVVPWSKAHWSGAETMAAPPRSRTVRTIPVIHREGRLFAARLPDDSIGSVAPKDSLLVFDTEDFIRLVEGSIYVLTIDGEAAARIRVRDGWRTAPEGGRASTLKDGKADVAVIGRVVRLDVVF